MQHVTYCYETSGLQAWKKSELQNLKKEETIMQQASESITLDRNPG